jgi:phosphotransferase system  glucose/maltose/N-acetylglucosamine-specific IIC component
MNRLVDLVWLLLAFDPASLRRQAATIAVAGTAILLLAITAYGALLFALSIYLAEKIGPIGASLSIAGGAIVLALILLLIARAKMSAERRRNHILAESRRVSLLAVVTALPQLRSRRLSALLAGFALGRAMNRRPGKRKSEDGDQ